MADKSAHGHGGAEAHATEAGPERHESRMCVVVPLSAITNAIAVIANAIAMSRLPLSLPPPLLPASLDARLLQVLGRGLGNGRGARGTAQILYARG